MDNVDFLYVQNDLKGGKCNWTLKTWLHLHDISQRKKISNWLGYGTVCDSVDTFYDWYNFYELTKDGFLLHGVDVHLQVAASHGNFEQVKLMIDLGATKFHSAMHDAVKYGHMSIIPLLLHHHPEYDKCLSWGIIFGKYDVVKFMIEQGVNLSRFSHKSISAAIEKGKGNIDVLTLLRDNCLP